MTWIITHNIIKTESILPHYPMLTPDLLSLDNHSYARGCSLLLTFILMEWYNRYIVYMTNTNQVKILLAIPNSQSIFVNNIDVM